MVRTREAAWYAIAIAGGKKVVRSNQKKNGGNFFFKVIDFTIRTIFMWEEVAWCIFCVLLTCYCFPRRRRQWIEKNTIRACFAG